MTIMIPFNFGFGGVFFFCQMKQTMECIYNRKLSWEIIFPHVVTRLQFLKHLATHSATGHCNLFNMWPLIREYPSNYKVKLVCYCCQMSKMSLSWLPLNYNFFKCHDFSIFKVWTFWQHLVSWFQKSNGKNLWRS